MQSCDQYAKRTPFILRTQQLQDQHSFQLRDRQTDIQSQKQQQKVSIQYVGVLVISISTASGSGEEEDYEISIGLDRISRFLRCLNKGRKSSWYPSFPPQPLLAQISDEQLEEEGGNEEIESQLINKGFNGDIKTDANRAKIAILNYFIKQGNPRPD
ncbi:MAG: hypothetical protein EZS28_054986, partial [Streblomastix strix]